MDFSVRKAHVVADLSSNGEKWYILLIIFLVSLSCFISLWTCLNHRSKKHMQSELCLLRLVRTARRTPYSFQARVNGYRPACSTVYPITIGYVWIRKFAFSCGNTPQVISGPFRGPSWTPTRTDKRPISGPISVSPANQMSVYSDQSQVTLFWPITDDKPHSYWIVHSI